MNSSRGHVIEIVWLCGYDVINVGRSCDVNSKSVPPDPNPPYHLFLRNKTTIHTDIHINGQLRVTN